MADLNKIVQRYEVQSDTSGLDKIAAAADKASVATKKLSDTASTLSTATEKADKSALGVATQLDRLSKAADPAQKALAAVERQQRLIDAATKQGQPIRQEWTNALAILKARHEELTKATAAHSASVGLNRTQLLEATHVAKSFADSLVAGASPLRALSLEGGRIAQIFAEGNGGVGGTLRAATATVAKLATGWVGLGASVAIGAGLAGAAILRFSAQQDALARSLNGSGRAAGLTLGGLSGIVSGAASSGLGLGSATSAAASLVSTGQISGSILPGILGQIRPYANATGASMEDTGSLFAKAFADPSKGSVELSSRLGFLDDKTRTWIDSLEASGQHLEAQRALLDKVTEATAAATDRTWSMTKAFRDLGETADNWLNKIGSRINSNGNALFNGDTPEGRLAKLEYQLESAQRGNLGGNIFGQSVGNGGLVRSLQAQIGAARSVVGYQEYGDTREAQRQADIQRAQLLSNKAGDATRALDPTLTRTRELDDRIRLLEGALSDPEISGRVSGGASAISRSLSLARNEQATLDPFTRVRQDAALSVQAIQAETGAERTLIEARRAEIEAMRSTHDGAIAAAKSLEVWNNAIANSNKATRDALRDAKDDLSLTGKSPYQRDYLQTRIRARNMLNDAVTGVPGVSSLSPDDLRMTALEPDATKALRRAFGNAAPSSDALDLAHDLTGGFVSTASAAASLSPFPSRRIGGYSPAASRFAPGNIAIGSTAKANVGQFVQVSDQRNYETNLLEPLRQANQELTLNENLLRARTAAFGKDTFELNKSIAAQELWNKLIQSGLNDAKLSTDQTKQLSKGVQDYADRSAKLQKQAEDEQKRQDLVSSVNDFGRNFVGSASNDLFSTLKSNPRDLVSQLSQGQQAEYYAGRLSGNQVKSIVAQHQIGDLFQKMIYDQGIDLIKTGLFGSGKKGGGDGLIGGLVKSAIGALGFADGGIMTNMGPVPLRRYAGGGVANSPQMAMFGEGSKPEAYVPLPDGRSIPVAMKGGGGGHTINISHSINVAGNADEKTVALMDQKIAAANRQLSADLQRNLGQQSAKWQQRYGA